MYRPNRIGPWAKWNSNKTQWINAVTDGALIGHTGYADIFPQIEATTLDENGQFQVIVTAVTISANEQIAFGVPVIADFKDGKYQMSITGACQLHNTGSTYGKAEIFPFLAKAKSATLVVDETANTNESEEFIILKNQAYDNMCCVNQCVVVEDTAENAKPFITGFAIRNRFSTDYTLSINANMSVEKYVEDTKVFDPNR